MGEQETSEPDQGPTVAKMVQGRPAELEDWLNGRIYHPLSIRLAKALVPTPITPNMVSVTGGAMIVLATFAYALGDGWPAIVLGLALHMSWHVFDGADGDLARLTGKTSSTGEVIDGICDYVGHIILYVTLGTMLAAEIGAATAWTFAIGAGAGRIVQAAHYEVQRRQYQHWVYDTDWLRVSAKNPDKPAGVIGFFASYYVNLAKLLAPGGREVDALVAEARGEQRSTLRVVIRKETVPVLRSTYLLSANYRTLALGVSMLAGTPLYFFAFEAIGLTVVLVASIITAARAARRIQDQAKTLR